MVARIPANRIGVDSVPVQSSNPAASCAMYGFWYESSGGSMLYGSNACPSPSSDPIAISQTANRHRGVSGLPVGNSASNRNSHRKNSESNAGDASHSAG